MCYTSCSTRTSPHCRSPQDSAVRSSTNPHPLFTRSMQYHLVRSRSQSLAMGSRPADTSRSAGTSMAHTPGPKRIEMFDPQARYLLATSLRNSSTLGHCLDVTELDDLVMPGAMPVPVSRSGAPGKGKRRAPPVEVTKQELLGYCSFRFDTEQTAGTRDAEVVYWCVGRRSHFPVAPGGVRRTAIQRRITRRGEGTGWDGSQDGSRRVADPVAMSCRSRLRRGGWGWERCSLMRWR
jgi:hypothetical protein